MPYSRKEMPPMTGPGMVWIRADSFPMKEQMIERTAAPAMTRTLYTPVIAMTPMFSP